jgi:predicted small metal-binding protein
MKQLVGAMLAIVLILSFSTITFAQDKMQKEEKKPEKMEMAKDEAKMGPLKSITCDPACGFMVRSHSEKELISMAKMHAKKMHKKDMTDKDLMGMMKTEEGTEMKK